MFHDYPPGYMYVLYIVGAIEKLFGFSDGAQYALVKLPAIVCDILAGVLIYKVAKKKVFRWTFNRVRVAIPFQSRNCSKLFSLGTS